MRRQTRKLAIVPLALLLAGCDTLPDGYDAAFNWPDRPPSLFTVVNKTQLTRVIFKWYGKTYVTYSPQQSVLPRDAAALSKGPRLGEDLPDPLAVDLDDHDFPGFDPWDLPDPPDDPWDSLPPEDPFDLPPPDLDDLPPLDDDFPVFTSNNNSNSVTSLSSGGFSAGGAGPKYGGLAAASNAATTPVNIPVGSAPSGIAFIPGKKVLVANEASASLSVIDVTTRAVVDSIPLPNDFFPHGLDITPDGTQAWVTSKTNRNATVLVVDLATKKYQTTPLLGNSYIKVKLTPDGSQAWVVSDFDNSVTVVDTATRTIVTTIRNIPNAWDLVINPTGTRVYIVSSSLLDSQVKVIDTATYSVIASIPTTGNRARDIKMSPDGRLLFVTHHDSNFISQIDTIKGVTVRKIDVGGRSSGLMLVKASRSK